MGCSYSFIRKTRVATHDFLRKIHCSLGALISLRALTLASFSVAVSAALSLHSVAQTPSPKIMAPMSVPTPTITPVPSYMVQSAILGDPQLYHSLGSVRTVSDLSDKSWQASPMPNLGKNVGAADAKKPLKVMYISPYQNPFWLSVGDFLKEVAKDLHVDLRFVDAGSRFHMMKMAEDIRLSEDIPDYLIIPYQEGVSPELFRAANTRGIKTFVINMEVAEDEKILLGQPREKMPLWLGHIYSSNTDVGCRLLKALLEEKCRRVCKAGETPDSFFNDPKQHVELLAINGDKLATDGVNRDTGLKQCLSNYSSVELVRDISTQWDEEQAYRGTYELLKMYPNVDLIWAASDVLASGAISAIHASGLEPGKDVLVAGVDWSLSGAENVKNNDMLVSFGGHFMEAGWALILLVDYENGHDFVSELGAEITMPLQTLYADRANAFLALFATPAWKRIDYSQLSKTYNKKLTHYDFSLSHLLTLPNKAEKTYK